MVQNYKEGIQLMRFGLITAAFVLLSAGQVFGAGLSICDGAAGNLVANCGFESGDFSGWNTGGNFDENTFVSNLPSYVHSGDFGMQGGPVGSSAFLSQTLSTSVGTSYTFSFALSNDGGTPNSFTAWWNGDQKLSFSDNGGFGMFSFSFSVIGTGSDTIQFDFQQDPAFWGLDDVVVADPAAVAAPEPGTFALLLGGILPVLAIARKRKVC
jgi:hypothetical protein